MDTNFELFDVELIVSQINGECTCTMKIGDKVHFSGGKFSLPSNKNFCTFALQSALILIPAKQRQNHSNDWMETDSEVNCPDPACGLIMKIVRQDLKQFDHNDVSANKIG